MKRIVLSMFVALLTVTAWAQTAQVIWTAGNSTLTFLCSPTIIGVGETYNGQTVTLAWRGEDVTDRGRNKPVWGNSTYQYVTRVVFDSSFASVRPTSTYYWFVQYEKLTQIEGLEYLDTSEVTDMFGMFQNCHGLPSVDLSHFNTSKVTDMSQMFLDCHSLTSLDVSSFDTSNVVDMHSMFQRCYALERIDGLSRFDTSKVTNMEGMFYGGYKLSNIDVSHFSTSNVVYMDWMFYSCRLLTSLDVSMFDTSSVTAMHMMFMNCSALTSLDVTGFDTSNVTGMQGVFANCSGLTELDVSHFDTSNVTHMNLMFRNCSGLTSLDVTGFDTSNVTWMNSMFQGCSGIYYLDLTNFKTDAVTNYSNMLADMGYCFVYMTDTEKNQAIGVTKNDNSRNFVIGSTGSFTCANCVFAEEGRDAWKLPYGFTAENITYERTLNSGGNAYTVFLPYDLEIPADMKAYQLREGDKQVTDNIIYFEEVTGTMKANTPYLVANWGTANSTTMLNKTTDTKVVNTISYKDKTTYDGPDAVATTLKNGIRVSMEGMYAKLMKNEIADQGYYIMQTGNKWKPVTSASKNSVYIGPFRAFLRKTSGGEVSQFNGQLVDSDETGGTEIETIDHDGTRTRYDLSGRRLLRPTRGIHIIGGKKILNK